MLTCDAISMAAYASVPVAVWLGVLTVAQLIAVTLIAGAATVFFRSAYQVLLPGIVDEADLAEGNAKLMGSREVAQIGGPGLGGALAQIVGPAVGLLADGASFAVSFVYLAAVRRPRDRRTARPRTSSLTQEALDGLRFLWHDFYLRVMARSSRARSDSGSGPREPCSSPTPVACPSASCSPSRTRGRASCSPSSRTSWPPAGSSSGTSSARASGRPTSRRTCWDASAQ
jgi:hypothetical protein